MFTFDRNENVFEKRNILKLEELKESFVKIDFRNDLLGMEVRAEWDYGCLKMQDGSRLGRDNVLTTQTCVRMMYKCNISVWFYLLRHKRGHCYRRRASTQYFCSSCFIMSSYNALPQ